MSSPTATLTSQFADEDGEEDEETLQLKLEEIQARLRLKKLQNAKARELEAKPINENVEFASDPKPAPAPRPRPRAGRATTPVAEENRQPAHYTQIQVPASPVRKLQLFQQQTSPSKFLGIDKGRKAKDVSLKRAPSNTGTQAGRHLSQVTNGQQSGAPANSSRPLSFNERLAATRTDETVRAERRARIQKIRTNAFGIDQSEMEQYKSNAVDIPDEPIQAPNFSREDILSQGRGGMSKLPRSQTAPSLQSVSTDNSSSHTLAGDSESSSFEPYSCFHLSKRILPHNVVARHVSGKKVMNIKELLRVVKSPEFALPDVEQDIVVFAVAARKSEARAHKTQKDGEERGKYMVVTLTDLGFELDLFLFNSGFTRFWKVTEGTVVAILNPTIMPPPRGREDTGKFSLVINSDEDTILEIGMSRDLGFCQSVKKDGNICGSWVNVKKTHYCEFHSNEAISKQRSTRIEMNTASFGAGGQKKREHREKYIRKEENSRQAPPGKYDWDTKTQYFATRSMSAADLIDGKDRGPSDRREKAEFLKRSLEAKEKERDMMKKLGRIGNAAGREYMERGSNQGALASSQRTSDDAQRQPDLLGLGLVSKDRAIHLSPIKRKRPLSLPPSQASSTVGSSSRSGFGWGSGLKDKLSKMKDGETLHGREPPVRKKTRFVTEKGIREAGRESLGMELTEQHDDDDEDELVII